MEILPYIENYIQKRDVSMKISEIHHGARMLEMKANKMNNSRLLKPSFKQVEEFIKMIQQLKESIQPIDKYDITIQNRVLDLKGMQTESLSECEVFAKEIADISLLMRNEVPFWWRGVLISPIIKLTIGEYCGMLLLIAAILISL